MSAVWVPTEALREWEGECSILSRFWGYTSDHWGSFASAGIMASLQALPLSACGSSSGSLHPNVPLLKRIPLAGLRATLLQDMCKDLVVTFAGAWGYDFVIASQGTKFNPQQGVMVMSQWGPLLSGMSLQLQRAEMGEEEGSWAGEYE